MLKQLKAFLKWVAVSIVVGLASGLLGTVFHISVEYVTEIRIENSWLIFLLPVGGLLITLIYRPFKNKGNIDTNRVIEASKEDKDVPIVMVPLIFAGTVITHFLGGSAGREGAALQLGGGLGYNIGRVFGLSKKDLQTIVMAGMSGVFAALFGTPITAAIFAMEVAKVGTIRYDSLVPCIVTSLISYGVALKFGVSPVRFLDVALQSLSVVVVVKVIILALLCALVSMLFCFSIHKCEHITEKLMPNGYIRTVVCAAVIVILTFIVGTYDYNGVGMNVISDAIKGNARPEAFILKMIFTVITISAGFKGGEIVPTFFIGSTFGCVVGGLLGLSPGFGAAIGFVALFCGVTNCPVASILLAVEVFGGEAALMFAVACGISYVMSGNWSLYKSQEFECSKII